MLLQTSIVFGLTLMAEQKLAVTRYGTRYITSGFWPWTSSASPHTHRGSAGIDY